MSLATWLSSVSSPSLPRGLGAGAESFSLLILCLLSLAWPSLLRGNYTRAHLESSRQHKLRCGPKGRLMNNKRKLLFARWFFGALCYQRDKTQIYYTVLYFASGFVRFLLWGAKVVDPMRGSWFARLQRIVGSKGGRDFGGNLSEELVSGYASLGWELESHQEMEASGKTLSVSLLAIFGLHFCSIITLPLIVFVPSFYVLLHPRAFADL